MPLLKVKSGETKQEFDNRCMSNEKMIEEYPDEKQRFAVCQDIWDGAQRKKLDKGVCYRTYKDDIEFRFDENEGTRTIEGYAAKFGKWSQDLGGFREIIDRGAFKKTLKEADIRILQNHDSNFVLGRNKSGTAELWEDKTGLRFKVNLPDTSYAKDLVEIMKRGDVTQCSFGFIPIKDEWRNDFSERVLKEVRLFDASIVTYPAYEDTEAQVRNMKQIRETVINENKEPEETHSEEVEKITSKEKLQRKRRCIELQIFKGVLDG
jgi:HK97 family phage prohead protease